MTTDITKNIAPSSNLSLGQKIDLCVASLPAQFRYVPDPATGGDPMDGLLMGILELCVSLSDASTRLGQVEAGRDEWAHKYAEAANMRDHYKKWATDRAAEADAAMTYAVAAVQELHAALDKLNPVNEAQDKWIADRRERFPKSGHEIGTKQRQGADSPASATTDPSGEQDKARDAVTTAAPPLNAPLATPGAQSAPATHLSHAVGHCYIAANGIDDRCPPGGCVALEECMRESRAKGSHSQDTLHVGDRQRVVAEGYCLNCGYPEAAHRISDKSCPVAWHRLYHFEPQTIPAQSVPQEKT